MMTIYHHAPTSGNVSTLNSANDCATCRTCSIGEYWNEATCIACPAPATEMDPDASEPCADTLRRLGVRYLRHI
jgi:hypothetical protein